MEEKDRLQLKIQDDEYYTRYDYKDRKEKINEIKEKNKKNLDKNLYISNEILDTDIKYKTYFKYINENLGEIIYHEKNKINEIINNNLIENINKKTELQNHFTKLIEDKINKIEVDMDCNLNETFYGSLYRFAPKNNFSYKAWFEDFIKNIGEIVYKHEKRILTNRYLGISDLLTDFDGLHISTNIFFSNDFDSEPLNLLEEEVNESSQDEDFNEVESRSIFSAKPIDVSYGIEGKDYYNHQEVYGETYTSVALEKLENGNIKTKYMKNEFLRLVDIYEMLLAEKKIKNKKDFNKLLYTGNSKNNYLHIDRVRNKYFKSFSCGLSPYNINFVYEILYDKNHKILETKKYIEGLKVNLNDINGQKEYENINYLADGNFEFLHRFSRDIENEFNEKEAK